MKLFSLFSKKQVEVKQTSNPLACIKPGDDIAIILRTIHDNMDKKTLEDKVLVNILADYGVFTNMPAAKNVITTLQQQGYILKIKNANNWNIDLHTIVSNAISKLGLSDELCLRIINSFGYAYHHTEIITVSQSDIMPNRYPDKKPKVESTLERTAESTDQEDKISIDDIIEQLRYKNKVVRGTYKEKLKTGGELVITSSTWKIEYSSEGTGIQTYFSINGVDIDKYAKAWRKNFELYKKIKETFPLSGEYVVKGELDMVIKHGMRDTWQDGVWLREWIYSINHPRVLEKVLEDYEYAKSRVKEFYTSTNSLS